VGALLFDLDGINVVMGMDLLASNGGIWVDWAKHAMGFQFNTKWVELKGKKSGNVRLLALQSFLGRLKHVIEGVHLSTEGYFSQGV
jgi:hypothetical protein